MNNTVSVTVEILKRCRIQIGLSLDQVRKKVQSIEKIEDGAKDPTFKQLDALADLYEVPRWVFVSEQLPEEYTYDHRPSFRKFRSTINAGESTDGKKGLGRIIARVEKYRELFIELAREIDAPVPYFEPPNINRSNARESAQIVRDWLSLGRDETPEFAVYRERMEAKGIFIFLTSKFLGWSHIGRNIFRGLCIYYEQTPIIIINDSDARKAQSFTLIHELGHLLQQNTAMTAIDDWAEPDTREEKWCDDLAGNILIPETLINDRAFTFESIKSIKAIAEKFNVSPYACLVRLRRLDKISQPQYEYLEKQLKDEYDRLQQKLQDSKGGPTRNRSKEVARQFGAPLTKTLMTAFYNEDLNLHQSMKLLGLKQYSHFAQLEEDMQQ